MKLIFLQNNSVTYTMHVLRKEVGTSTNENLTYIGTKLKETQYIIQS